MKATPEQLAKIAIFSKLDARSLLTLSQFSQIEIYKRGETLIQEGDCFPPKLHSVLSGEIIAKKVSVSGKETILRRLPAGEIFAAPAIFGDGIAIATVVALQNCQILTVEKAALLQAIQSDPEIALQILNCFNQRLQEMHRTIHGLISERAIVRLARVLQYTAQKYGTEQSGGEACINYQLPYQQLSRMIGISYEECVRFMNKNFQSIIRYDRGGTIHILDPIALEKIASEAIESSDLIY
jgi:CRP/FNR family transcriptional regulator, cyclic AMP receptor protein